MIRLLRTKISEILIKWDMPTRQPAIGEIVQEFDTLLDSLLKEVEGKKEEIDDALYSWDAYPHSGKQADQVIVIFSHLINNLKDNIK